MKHDFYVLFFFFFLGGGGGGEGGGIFCPNGLMDIQWLNELFPLVLSACVVWVIFFV